MLGDTMVTIGGTIIGGQFCNVDKSGKVNYLNVLQCEEFKIYSLNRLNKNSLIMYLSIITSFRPCVFILKFQYYFVVVPI